MRYISIESRFNTELCVILSLSLTDRMLIKLHRQIAFESRTINVPSGPSNLSLVTIMPTAPD